jgi:hypothetical protein
MGVAELMTDAGRQLSGLLTTADAVLTAVRARQNEIGLSNAMLDELSGFADGTSNKYCGPSREKMPLVSTLFLMLGAMGVGVVLVEDADAVKRLSGRWTRRQDNHIQSTGRLAQVAIQRALPAAITKLASSGGKSRWEGVDADERREHMRELARKRWAA